MTHSNRSCYLCKSTNADVVSTTVSQAPASCIYRCQQCDLVYLFPIMPPAEEKTFYNAEFEKYMENRSGPGWKSPEAHFRSYQAEGKRRLPLVTPYLKPQDEILEIGSSTGYFLSQLRSSTKSVTGVEPHPLYREFANSQGLQTHPNLAALKEMKFDVIFFYYVLEHLRDPIDYLLSLRSHLNSGGRLILEVPNVNDVLLSPYTIPNFAPFYWQKAHYFNFSHQSLAKVLEKAGYRAELYPVQRYDLSNHLVWMMEGKPGGMGRFKDLFTPALETAYADALKTQWRCDSVMAVAR